MGHFPLTTVPQLARLFEGADSSFFLWPLLCFFSFESALLRVAQKQL